MKKRFLKVFLILLFFVAVWGEKYGAFSFYNGDEIKTDSVLLVNTDTQLPVFEKNPEKRRSMASLTKIMTYIIVLENVKDLKGEKVKVKKQVLSLVDEDSSIVGLKENDELTVFDLLHCLMIKSGNDAALVLADYVGKNSIDNFVNMMNTKTQELGCTDTHFVNADGMFNENHYSTAKDMYKITSYAMKLPYFMEICGKTRYKVFDDERSILRTTNKMMEPGEREYYYPYVKGIKTGWHSEAGRCLISYATKDSVSYICVAMGGPETDINGDKIKENFAMLDTKKLYTWAFENLALKTMVNKDAPLGQVKLKYSWGKDKIILSPGIAVRMIVPKDLEFSNLDVEYVLPDFINAPVEAGDLVGTAKLKYDNNLLLETNLVSSETAQFNFFAFIIAKTKDVISSKAFITLFSCLSLLLALYLIFLRLYGKLIRNKRRKSRNIRRKNIYR
jgi:D-alanyl-D-alanine carboxypeptidase